MTTTLFHLAFPCHDFDKAKFFYCDTLGFTLGRQSKSAMIINFSNNQIVAHKTDSANQRQENIYPRHFGLVFLQFDDYQKLVNKVEESGLEFHVLPKIRFANTAIEHHSFFLCDPSNNLLEFKYYSNYQAIFGETEFSQVGES